MVDVTLRVTPTNAEAETEAGAGGQEAAYMSEAVVLQPEIELSSHEEDELSSRKDDSSGHKEDELSLANPPALAARPLTEQCFAAAQRVCQVRLNVCRVWVSEVYQLCVVTLREKKRHLPHLQLREQIPVGLDLKGRKFPRISCPNSNKVSS